MVYKTKGVCSTAIDIDIDTENDVINDVRFHGGCDGNLQGISRLLKEMSIEEAIQKLDGIKCERRGTSCPDQLAQALKTANR